MGFKREIITDLRDFTDRTEQFFIKNGSLSIRLNKNGLWLISGFQKVLDNKELLKYQDRLPQYENIILFCLNKTYP